MVICKGETDRRSGGGLDGGNLDLLCWVLVTSIGVGSLPLCLLGRQGRRRCCPSTGSCGRVQKSDSVVAHPQEQLGVHNLCENQMGQDLMSSLQRSQ